MMLFPSLAFIGLASRIFQNALLAGGDRGKKTLLNLLNVPVQAAGNMYTRLGQELFAKQG